MELKEKIIEIDYSDALIILKELEKKKHYWGETLLNLYRGHKKVVKKAHEGISISDLDWYVKKKIKSLLEMVTEENKAYFKILTIT